MDIEALGLDPLILIGLDWICDTASADPGDSLYLKAHSEVHRCLVSTFC